MISRPTNNMENLSLFDLFGEEAAEYKPVEVKKPEKPEKKEIKKPDKVLSYKLPLKVITGVFPEFSIKADEFGKETITEPELAELIGNRFEQFPKALTKQEVKGMLVKVYHKEYVSSLNKQKMTLDEGWKITLNGFSLPLEEGTEVDEETIRALWEAQYPAFKGIKTKYLYDKVKKVIVPMIESDKLDEEVKFPATVFLFGQEEILFSENTPEEAMAPAAEATSDEDDSDETPDESEDESEEEATEAPEDTPDEEAAEGEAGNKPAAKAEDKKPKKKTISALRKLLSERFGGMKFAVAKNAEGKYMAQPSLAYVQTLPPEKKEETYPTEDTQIGLIFTKIKLSPELFGGKKEVTKKEICKFLSKDYEEFADTERVTIIYDKARKLIKPMIAAARKGAISNVVYSQAEVDEILARDGYQLVNFSEDPKHLWRIEKTPLGTFKMLWAAGRNFIGNTFEYALPKIPQSIWRKMIYMFRKYAQKGLEVICMLVFNKRLGEYELLIPEQEVGPTFVNFDPSQIMRLAIEDDDIILVGDFHSHHEIDAYFSTTDDKDEKRAGLFGVFGSYDDKTKRYNFLLRAGTQGMYCPMDPADVFENWEDRFSILSVVPYAFLNNEGARIKSRYVDHALI